MKKLLPGLILILNACSSQPKTSSSLSTDDPNLMTRQLPQINVNGQAYLVSIEKMDDSFVYLTSKISNEKKAIAANRQFVESLGLGKVIKSECKGEDFLYSWNDSKGTLSVLRPQLGRFAEYPAATSTKGTESFASGAGPECSVFLIGYADFRSGWGVSFVTEINLDGKILNEWNYHPLREPNVPGDISFLKVGPEKWPARIVYQRKTKSKLKVSFIEPYKNQKLGEYTLPITEENICSFLAPQVYENTATHRCRERGAKEDTIFVVDFAKGKILEAKKAPIEQDTYAP